VDVEMTVVGKQ